MNYKDLPWLPQGDYTKGETKFIIILQQISFSNITYSVVKAVGGELDGKYFKL